ncbi:MAG: hypothetical protein E6248_13865 [Clostridium sp.]|uniref:hypothetical protein n=1 Tax=Clostridium sp. TaxID=1506 RepID=UPI0029144220|nr:hypothetical protein [Clostridium sp.]MDU5111528.1 hypothetical protein [Clostridium sp.]
MEIILAILLGGFFGFALSLAKATNFNKILKMLRLEDLSLAKIILFAIGFSSVLLSLSNALGIFDISNLSVKTMNLGVVLGGLLFGFAFGSIGTCPGTCLGAITNKNTIKKALAAVLGGLFGAFLFSLSYGPLKEMGVFDALNLGKITLFNVSEKFPSVFEFGFTGLFLVGVLFMIAAYFLPISILKPEDK